MDHHLPKEKGKVLIVEDDPGIAELLKDFFMEYGYESDTAQDGIEADGLLKEGAYELILTDVIFFQSGGIDLITNIRSKDTKIPIVAMTGFGPEVAQEAMDAGADDFLLKPFDLSYMKKKIGRFIDFESMEKRFGIIAIERGFISSDHLIEGLKVQVGEELGEGKHTLIGKIFLEKGQMTAEQIDEVTKSLYEEEDKSSM